MVFKEYAKFPDKVPDELHELWKGLDGRIGKKETSAQKKRVPELNEQMKQHWVIPGADQMLEGDRSLAATIMQRKTLVDNTMMTPVTAEPSQGTVGWSPLGEPNEGRTFGRRGSSTSRSCAMPRESAIPT